MSKKDKRSGPGRPTGSTAERKKKVGTVWLFPEDWDALDKIGPSRGRAVEWLLEKHHKQDNI